jgi:pilus assembly protein Flp/PilA
MWAMHLWEFTMIEYMKTWLELKLDRRAVTALEYGLIAGVIVATITVGFSLLANSLSKSFSQIGGSL